MPFKFIGAQPPWTSPGLCLQLRGAGWGRLEGAAAGEGSRGSQAFYYLQVSRTPRPCSTPWRPERREEGGGGAGDTGIPPGSSRRRRGGGDRPCVPRCTGCPAGTDCSAGLQGGPGAPLPRVQRAFGLGVLVSPLLRLAPRRARDWIRGSAVRVVLGGRADPAGPPLCAHSKRKSRDWQQDRLGTHQSSREQEVISTSKDLRLRNFQLC